MIETAFDIETADADRLYTGGHLGEFVRLAGARTTSHGRSADWVGAPVDAYLDTLRAADVIYGHNVFRFDIPALARHFQTDYWELASRAVDTIVLARLADPPGARGQKPWSVPGYYSLDAVAARLGVAGVRQGSKGNLMELASLYGGLDRIPVDDQVYRDYLRDDLAEGEAVYRALLPSLDDYARREMKVVAIQHRMTLNGWRIDTDLLDARVRQEARIQRDALETLHGTYGLPRTGGTAPVGSKAGRAWLQAAYDACGVADPPRTAKGALAIGKDVLQSLVSRPGFPAPLADALRLVLTATGASLKYREIQNHLIGDRVHGGIGGDQASGRWAMTRPSLTNLGKRGPKIAERAPFLPEQGHVLVAFDMDQVDMRAIAGLCQDPAYMSLFGPGKDAHSMIADAVFGRHDGEWRDRSKRCGHGWNYGMGVSGLVRSGVEEATARKFDAQMIAQFPVLCGWREEIRAIGAAGVLLDNGFGRRMRCDPQRAHTQAPALMGQGGARDLLCEGLVRLDPAVHGMLRGVVHDEVVFSVPLELEREVREHVREAMTFAWKGVPITTGSSASGANWAACYDKP